MVSFLRAIYPVAPGIVPELVGVPTLNAVAWAIFGAVTAAASILSVGFPGSTSDATMRQGQMPLAQQISRDPFSDDGGQHGTQVEIDTFSYVTPFGPTIVATFQSGRFALGGGATVNSFATSLDAGAHWTTGHLPGLTVATGGEAARATDPSVAYDAKHGMWLIASLRLRPPIGTLMGYSDYVVSRSPDGIGWGEPVVAAPQTTQPHPIYGGFAHDQGWIVCDNHESIPNGSANDFYGRCYLSYLDTATRRGALTYSDDGGASWSTPQLTSIGIGQPLVRPDGSLAMIHGGFAQPEGRGYYFSVSRDGGQTFSIPVRIAPDYDHTLASMRAPAKHSAEIDRAGRIYVAWQGCLSPGCSDNNVVFVSGNGESWAAPRLLPIPDGPRSETEQFVVGLGVDATTANPARLAISYYTMPSDTCTPERCDLEVEFIWSPDSGRRWSAPVTLNRAVMQRSWVAQIGDGSRIVGFVGDYGSTSFSQRGIAVAVFSFADRAPLDGTYSQGAWAAHVNLGHTCELQHATAAGSGSDDAINGTDADDVLVGDAGNDTILARAGDDLICAGEGDDTVHGGRGADTVSYASVGQSVTANLTDGIAVGDGIDVLSEVEALIGSWHADELHGSGNEDRLIGRAGNDSLLGGGATDWLTGGEGNDLLVGGSESDTLIGGTGNDRLMGGSGYDTCYPGPGRDELRSCEDVR